MTVYRCVVCCDYGCEFCPAVKIRAGASRPSLALTVAAGRSPLPRPAATPPSSRLPDWKQRGLLNAHRWEEPR